MPLYLLELYFFDQVQFEHTLYIEIEAKSDEIAIKKANIISEDRYGRALKERPHLRFSQKPKLYKTTKIEFDYPVPMMAKEDMERILRTVHDKKLRTMWKRLIKETYGE